MNLKVESNEKPSKFMDRLKRKSIPQQIDQETMKIQNLIKANIHQGFIISEVFQNSPADRADCQVGDIITHVNGNQVNSSIQLFEMMGLETTPFQLTVCRFENDKVNTLNLEIKPEELDVFDKSKFILLAGNNENSIDVLMDSLDEEKRRKLEFLK